MGFTRQFSFSREACQDDVTMIVRSTLLVVLMTLRATVATGQFNTGGISGVARDTSGGVLPGATVIATHIATGAGVERLTDNDGRFFLPALRLGTWNVEARLAGLSPQVHQVAVEVGRTIAVDFSLAVEGLAEKIEVQSTLPLLQAMTAEISDVIENREGHRRVVQQPRDQPVG
jgi:carboxypeptidase family protein